jgi:hypothetical protein
MSFIES